MTIANLFQTPVKDEYGNTFPQAQVAILEDEVFTSRSRKADDVGSEYDIESNLVGCSYKVQYYGNPQAKSQGFITRPLKAFVDGQFTDEFEVDMKNPEIEAIMGNISLTDDQKTDLAIKKDLIKRFR